MYFDIAASHELFFSYITMSSLLFVATCVLQIVKRYTRKTLTMSFLFNLDVFFLYFFKLGFLNARLNSHYEAGSHKKKEAQKDLSIQEISLETACI